MFTDNWIDKLKEDELSHLFLLSNLETEHLNTEIVMGFSADSIVIVQRNGIDQIAGFYAESEQDMKQIGEWFRGTDLVFEAPYDRMVQLLASIGEKRMPKRYYLLMHDGSVPKTSKRKLEHVLITDASEYEKYIRLGLREIFHLRNRQTAQLVRDENFLSYINRGVFMFTIDNELVGFIQIKNQTQNYVELSNLWVRKSLRGKGYSNEIVTTIVQLFREQGKKCLVVLSQDHYGMLRFFENEDFEMVRVLSREKLE